MLALQATLLLLLGAALSPSEQASVAVNRLQPLAPRLQHRQLFRPFPAPPRRGLRQTLRAEGVSELYLDQVLDHNNPINKATWKQRYFARSDLFKEGGPVFIFISDPLSDEGEGLHNGGFFMTYLAESFQAKMFELEHRYYGKSRPTRDLSTANLQYLSADQALADLANFIEYLKESGDIAEGQKVVVFGRFYAGSLAAWARLKYPHLVHAAVSSSAPVHAKADFFEYMEVVGSSLTKSAGQFCYDNIKKATDRVVELLKTDEGYKKVRDTFHVGTELKDEQDLHAFFELLSRPFASAVEINEDFMEELDFSIPLMCNLMSGDDLTPDEAMTKLAYIVVRGQVEPGHGLDWSYRSNNELYQDIKFDSDAWSRQWLYQECTQFGFFQTYSSSNNPFPQEYNDVNFHYQRCKDVFGPEFGKDVLDAAIKRTNLVYGDAVSSVTNVIFVNGDLDPWHPLGVLSNISSTAPAVVIEGSSYCGDTMYPYADIDTPAVTAAHNTIKEFLRGALSA